MKLFKRNTKSNKSTSKLGEFTVKDYPKDNRNKNFYFYEYCKPDGQWIEKDKPICIIKIGESVGYTFKSGTVLASRAGVLEWTVEKDCLLKEKMIFYKLHDKGIYNGENSVEKDEYKHYFESDGNKCSFGTWLVSDGSFIKKGENLYKYKDSKYNEYIHKAEKDGYIHIIDPGKIYSIEKNELLYFIRKNDNQRINEKYKNVANIVNDEFTNTTNILWDRLSSKSSSGYGIISKSDDNLTDLTFSFNYLQNSDNIVFHFNPKQIRPKKNDKIIFLFEDGSLIEFVINNNPISLKNRNGEKVLEYKSLITKSELESFINIDFKKWKIDLINDNREILGGNKGSLIDYESKSNLITVIRKFGADYIETVQANIDDYRPIETRITNELIEPKQDICFVYLMHDTANGYYKIGISNKPYYREHTLQSEKPAIELIASKKFPVRKIAESIEKSLHDVFSEKRLRGEWFELNETDVKHIIETLK